MKIICKSEVTTTVLARQKQSFLATLKSQICSPAIPGLNFNAGELQLTLKTSGEL